MKPPSNFSFTKFLKPTLPALRTLIPSFFILLLIGFLVWLWVWGDEWTVNEVKPFAPIINRWFATLLIFLVALLWGAIKIYRKLRILEQQRNAAEAIVDPLELAKQKQNNYLDKWLVTLNKQLGFNNSVYSLPWYFVVGATNSGVTTLVQRSNKLDAIVRVKNTSSDDSSLIDCWLAEDAILFSADGKLFSQSEYAENLPILNSLWLGLLEWFESRRPRQPLNGVVLVVDIHQFAIFEQKDKEAYIEMLKNRLQDIMKVSQNNLPIYLVLNKLDLLYGFEALFQSLTKTQREAILGVTFKVEDSDVEHSWQSQFETFWGEWMASLNEALFELMANHVEPSQRSQLFTFTRQIAGLQPIIHELLSGLFVKNEVTQTHGQLLRGVYFTSATQEGRMEDLFVQSASNQYHLGLQPYPTWQNPETYTYFSQKLFKELIFAEPNIASDNIRYRKHYQKRMMFGGAFAVLSGLAFITGWQHYYNKNYAAGEQVLEQVKMFNNIETPEGRDPYGNLQLPLLDPIREATFAYGDHQDRYTFFADMGLYQGDNIGPLVESTYLKLIEQKFLPSLMYGLLLELTRAEESSDEKMEILRVMRMLDDGSNRNKDMILQFMEKRWSDKFTGQKELQERLLAHLRYALDKTDWVAQRVAGNKIAIADFEEFVQPIKNAQIELSKLPIYQRVYQNLRKQSELVLPAPLNMKEQIGPSFDTVFRANNDNLLLVPSILTREGMNNYFVQQSDQLIELTALDSWSLNLTQQINYSDADRIEIQKRVTDLYLSDYIGTWQGAINNLEVKPFDNLAHAVTALEQIISGDQPFKRALQSLKDNTKPREVPAGLEGDDLNKYLNNPTRLLLTKINHEFEQSISPIEEQVDKQSVLQDVYQKLGDLHRFLLAIQNAPSPGKAAMKAVQLRIDDNSTDPISALLQLAKVLPDPLDRWIQSIADEAWKVVMVQAINSLEVEWNDKVYSEYERLIANKYPFDPAANVDVSLSDFDRFFAPEKGILDLFYLEHLKPFIDNGLDGLETSEGASILREDILEQLDRANTIRRVFYTGENGFGVQYSVQPMELTPNKRRSLLNLDGQLLDFTHGRTDKVNLVWPNSMRSATESKLTLVPVADNRSPRSISNVGPWSQMHLFDRGKVLNHGDGYFDIRFNIDGGSMDYRLYYDESRNPFNSEMFREFSLPPTLY